MTKHLTFILTSTVIIACSSGNKTEVKTTDNDIKSTDKIESKEIR